MKTVVQRVSRAAVRVDDETVGAIGLGLAVLLGVEKGDEERDALVTARKIAGLRVFRGDHPMDRALADVGGEVLLISQFTLAGTVKKGRRPGFEAAMPPDEARRLYERVGRELVNLGVPVAYGRFGAMMEVELVGDGPVTILVFVRDGSVVSPR